MIRKVSRKQAKLAARWYRLGLDPRAVLRKFKDLQILQHPNLRKAVVRSQSKSQKGWATFRLADQSRLPPLPQLHPLD